MLLLSDNELHSSIFLASAACLHHHIETRSLACCHFQHGRRKCAHNHHLNEKGVIMSDQVVLITGALTGIGRATALIFAQQGARVVVSGRRDKEGQQLVAELRALGAEAEFVRTDVRVEEDVRNLLDQTVKRFGRLDIAVNNAATEGPRGLVTEQTAETYAATFDTNVLGVLLSMKHELRVMLPQ